jgi:hypothetical protein
MIRKLLGTDRVGIDEVSKRTILRQAKLHLSRNFDPVQYPDFAHLSVKVEPFDPDYGYWRVSIYARFGKLKEFVGHMNFLKNGRNKYISHPNGTKSRLNEIKEKLKAESDRSDVLDRTSLLAH